MRIPRLLTILGPASVLYVLAARVSSDVASSPPWWLTAPSCVLSLTPLAVTGARSNPRGASRLALMGVSLALALASARSGSSGFERIHGIAWLAVAVVMLDLVLPRTLGRLARSTIFAGLMLAAVVAAKLGQTGATPDSNFAAVIVAGMIAAGALHQILLVERGHAVEGALSGISIVGLAVGLAYVWLGPFEPPLAVALELLVAALLWFGHLAWLDTRWRSLRRVGVPMIMASAFCFVAAYAVAPIQPLGRWQLGFVALGAGILWWGVFSLVRRLSKRAAWSLPDRISSAVRSARRSLIGSTTLEEIAAGVLPPLADACAGGAGEIALYTFEPSLRIDLGTGERVSLRAAQISEPIAHAIFAQEEPAILDRAELSTRVVREPSIRALVETMEARSIGAVVPCTHDAHTEGLLCLPIGNRAEALSEIELSELGRLGRLVGGALASALAQRRAETHVNRVAALHRAAERQNALLEAEVEQLRGQCHVLGRGLAEDQNLHVAYSPSMRRVQTRAIELAPGEQPVLLVAPPGAPLLPVSRFIHDRGPRWEAPFVVADCSAASSDQAISLLFGSLDHRYAGWFYSATGGTLLLRDLPGLSREAQARLAEALRARESPREDGEADQPVPPRILATSRVAESELRRCDALDPDLADLLSGPGLVIPSLRQRREDIPSLVLLAIDKACRVLAHEPIGIDQGAMQALVDHDWPGDVAELELVMSLAVAKTTAKTISVADLPPLAWPKPNQAEPLDGTYLEVERRLLERVLRRAGGNKSEAARILGLKRTTFLDKLRRHGLERRAPQDVGGSAMG